MVYDKDFLVSAFVWRYRELPWPNFLSLLNMAEKFYDEVGKDKFRVYCSLDADALKEYKACSW